MAFKNFLIAFAVVFLSGTAHANLLTLTAGTTTKNGVNVSTAAMATVEGQSIELTTVGSGLRNKQVVFNIPVYVLQLMISKADLDRYVKTEAGALSSLSNVSTVTLRLDFLRDVPAGKITTSYQDGLDANGIDAKDSDVMKFMEVVAKAGDAKKAGSLTMVFVKNSDGTETLAYENIRDGKAELTTVKMTKDFTRKILSIWLGKTADNGLTALKTELMK